MAIQMGCWEGVMHARLFSRPMLQSTVRGGFFLIRHEFIAVISFLLIGYVLRKLSVQGDWIGYAAYGFLPLAILWPFIAGGIFANAARRVHLIRLLRGVRQRT